ncbi:MAG TPA: TlpA disulfide reductase family protein [Isosphaeraceae bacterium]
MTEMSSRAPRYRWAGWVVGLALAWVVYLIPWGPRGEGPRPEMRADFQWTMADLAGAPVEFAHYRGRPVFLNVWATWCPPCVAELPSIARLAANPALRDVAFLCVSVDEDVETVRRFVRDRGMTLPVAWDAGTMPAVFRTEGIPATFIIAPDGRIVRAEVGSAQWDNPSVIELLKSLAETAPAGGGSAPGVDPPAAAAPGGRTAVTGR